MRHNRSLVHAFIRDRQSDAHRSFTDTSHRAHETKIFMESPLRVVSFGNFTIFPSKTLKLPLCSLSLRLNFSCTCNVAIFKEMSPTIDKNVSVPNIGNEDESLFRMSPNLTGEICPITFLCSRFVTPSTRPTVGRLYNYIVTIL